MRTANVVTIQDQTQIGEARRAAQTLAMALGFAESEAGKISIIATEAASNLVKHAGPEGGEIILQAIQQGENVGIELLSIDRGPGIRNFAQSIRDGYSTAGTQGIGLGGIRRLSAGFDIFTVPERGTVLYSRVWSKPRAESRSAAFEVGGFALPMHGEVACGDAWDYELRADGTLQLAVADGLGHGLAASDASREAMRIFREKRQIELPQIFQESDQALRKTRGAAMAVLRLDPRSRLIRYVGVGNISSALVGSTKSQSLVSMGGIVGHECRNVHEFSYPLDPSALIIMHSDGLATRWDLANYPGVLGRHPTLIAGVLYRDFCRKRDDVTVVVARQGLGRSGTQAA